MVEDVCYLRYHCKCGWGVVPNGTLSGAVVSVVSVVALAGPVAIGSVVAEFMGGILTRPVGPLLAFLPAVGAPEARLASAAGVLITDTVIIAGAAGRPWALVLTAGTTVAVLTVACSRAVGAFETVSNATA